MTQTEFKNIAPKLHELKQLGSGFDVPKGYFETVEECVFEIIEEQKESVPVGYFESIEDAVFEKINSETKVISFKSRFVKRIIPLTVAASLLLFITLQMFNSDENDVFAQIEISEIENWIENGDLEFSSHEIALFYENTDLEDLNFNTTFNDDDLMDYLMDVNIESILTD